MKTYSEVTATSALVRIELELSSNVEYTASINGIKKSGNVICHWVPLTKPFAIEVELLSADSNILIKQITVDNIEVVPKFDQLATYMGSPTNYMDQVGKWTLTFDRPFYQWLHQATGQGWLLEP